MKKRAAKKEVGELAMRYLSEDEWKEFKKMDPDFKFNICVSYNIDQAMIRLACPVFMKAYEQRGVWVGQGLVQRLGDKMS